jgi:DNA adenine methylase
MATNATDVRTPAVLNEQVSRYPATRFMGSKEKLLPSLWSEMSRFQPRTVLDLCSGSGVVSYMLKAQGCRVIANDYMAMATAFGRALIANNEKTLAKDTIELIATADDAGDSFVERTYGTLYYSEENTRFVDCARTVLASLSTHDRDLAMAALIRACVKRRPRGIFTYTGHRYDDGRKDLKLGLRDHFRLAAEIINGAVFSNGKLNEVYRRDIGVEPPAAAGVDLVYLDPPYFSPLSDNEYVRRYHFVEALANDWNGVSIQPETKTKKIRNYPSPFSSEAGARKAFEALADHYKDLPLIVSYSSNSLPSASDIVSLLKRHRNHVELVEVDHRYSFANQGHLSEGAKNAVKELIFVAY